MFDTYVGESPLPMSLAAHNYVRKCCIASAVYYTRMCLHVTTGLGLLGMCGTVPGMGWQWEQHGCDGHVLPVAWEPLPCGLVALHGQGSLVVQLLEYAGSHWGPVHCFVVI
jgi:hypothetical protein